MTSRARRSWCAATTAFVVLLAATPRSGLAAQRGTAATMDTSLMTVVLRTAVREGLYTAHSADTPQVVCVGLDEADQPGPGWLERLADPPPSVMNELARGRQMPVRPRSACKLLPFDSTQREVSRVEDTHTGKRGILVWMDKPKPMVGSELTVNFAYYQHELSGAWWTCTVRRRSNGWEVASCQLLGVA